MLLIIVEGYPNRHTQQCYQVANVSLSTVTK